MLVIEGGGDVSDYAAVMRMIIEMTVVIISAWL
jgi:hypothetical protein